MLKKSIFSGLRKDFDAFESRRESIIKLGRDVLKSSKAAIYAIHRNELGKAKKLLSSASSVAKHIQVIVSRDPYLSAVGALNEALEEYVEAACYYSYVTKKELPGPKSLNVNVHVYLPGVCDLVGELVRKAINDVVKGDKESALEIKSFVASLYDELLLFDWRNTPVRRKFDSIKYGLEKLEDLTVQLKLKEA